MTPIRYDFMSIKRMGICSVHYKCIYCFMVAGDYIPVDPVNLTSVLVICIQTDHVLNHTNPKGHKHRSEKQSQWRNVTFDQICPDQAKTKGLRKRAECLHVNFCICCGKSTCCFRMCQSVCFHSDAPHLIVNLANPALIMNHASSPAQTQSEQIKESFQL